MPIFPQKLGVNGYGLNGMKKELLNHSTPEKMNLLNTERQIKEEPLGITTIMCDDPVDDVSKQVIEWTVRHK